MEAKHDSDITDLKNQINTIELIPGPQGAQGLPGPQGPEGPSNSGNSFVLTDANGDFLGDVITIESQDKVKVRVPFFLSDGTKIHSLVTFSTSNFEIMDNSVPYHVAGHVNSPQGYYVPSIVYTTNDCSGTPYISGENMFHGNAFFQLAVLSEQWDEDPSLDKMRLYAATSLKVEDRRFQSALVGAYFKYNDPINEPMYIKTAKVGGAILGLTNVVSGGYYSHFKYTFYYDMNLPQGCVPINPRVRKSLPVELLDDDIRGMFPAPYSLNVKK